MSRINPTKKRSGLVYANVYELVNIPNGKVLICIGKRWITKEAADIEQCMKDSYDKHMRERKENA